MPIEIQRSCYWSKCSFCDINFAKNISTKKLNDVIEELKFYKSTYGINDFIIIDSAISPVFLDKFSEAIIKNKLNIKFFCDARLEKQFTYKILKKAYKAGLRCIGWGIESVNPRISALMNKNINIKEGIKVLKNSDKAGIWNNVYLMVGFPSETLEEAMGNIDFAKEHRNIMHSICLSRFNLLKYSEIYNHYSDFGINSIDDTINFNLNVSYSSKCVMTNDEVSALLEQFDKNIDIFYQSIVHNCYYSQYSQYLLRYSLREIKRMYIKNKIFNMVKKFKLNSKK